MAETSGGKTLEWTCPKKQLVAEALIDLHRRLSALPSRSHDRRMIMRETATLYGVSEQTLYRALAERARSRALLGGAKNTGWKPQPFGARVAQDENGGSREREINQ